MSRFVAAGGAETDDAPKDAAREDAWAKAQEQLEALRKKPKPRVGEQEDGKSLYEVLQANKDAKQAEFEQQAKLKNQFRALDDDEVDFLDGIVSSEKAKEAAVRKETAEELESFRKQQQEADKASTVEEQTDPDAPADNAWRAKKRRRKEADIPITKVRKTTTDRSISPPPAAPDAPKTVPTAREEPTKKQPATSLGLAYASDSDDD